MKRKRWRREGLLARNRLEEEDKEEKRVGRKGRKKDGLLARKDGDEGGCCEKRWLMSGLEEKDEEEK